MHTSSYSFLLFFIPVKKKCPSNVEESYGEYKMSLLLQAITEKAIKTSIVFH